MNMNTSFTIENMNIELTTNCPLRCPQCYCTLTGGKNIDINIAKKCVLEAKELGLQELMLSGGETMCYPDLIELISFASLNGIKTNIALSGYKFNDSVLNELFAAGITGIFISLNGSTKEINSLTRDGYDLAINALKLLKQHDFPNTTINWVMHSSNADDFQNVLGIAEQYNVSRLAVMAVKPNSKKELSTIPSREQMLMVRDLIRNYKGNTKIVVETCFSSMLALIKDTKMLGNLNRGKYIGCGAGRWGVSVNVDGLFSPCRHLEYYEKWDSVEEYWNKSSILNKLRSVENDKKSPCSVCKYSDYCRHCLAINAKLHNDIYIGNEHCPIYEEK